MKHFSRSVALLLCVLLAALIAGSVAHAREIIAQGSSRDHLTEQEADIVREEQAIDRRTNVFIKAIERRLLALTDPNAARSKQVQKDLEKWGELPKGTRAELLTDISKILDEAITNIDDAATRDAKNPLLPKALRRLGEASTNFIAQFTRMRATVTSDEEREALEQAIENAQSVILAANKLPPPPAKKK